VRGEIGAVRPDHGRVLLVGEDLRERGSPRAGAEHGDVHERGSYHASPARVRRTSTSARGRSILARMNHAARLALPFAFAIALAACGGGATTSTVAISPTSGTDVAASAATNDFVNKEIDIGHPSNGVLADGAADAVLKAKSPPL